MGLHLFPFHIIMYAKAKVRIRFQVYTRCLHQRIYLETNLSAPASEKNKVFRAFAFAKAEKEAKVRMDAGIHTDAHGACFCLREMKRQKKGR